MASGKSIDLTQGPIFKKLLTFTFPIWVTGFLQQMYHSADLMVVGKFASDSSLAAVGATTTVTSLLLNLFIGISIASNILCARAFGSRDEEQSKKIIHTSLIFSFSMGVFLSIFGYFFTPPILRLIQTPEEILAEAVLYMRIIFLGQPASLMFTFCAGIFRARGLSSVPMRILSATGILNVLLNLLFVIGFHMNAAGVALATAIAHYVSIVAAMVIFFHPRGEFRLKLSEFRPDGKSFGEILRIGIPAGVNSILFNLSGTIVSAAANGLGKTVVASVSAANSVTHIVHTVGAAFTSAVVSFSAQNYGAGKLRRTTKMLAASLIIVEVVMLIVNTAITFFPQFFMGFFTNSTLVIETGTSKLLMTAWGYVLYAFSEQLTSGCRALGQSTRPTVINISCICLFRMAWVWWVFPFLDRGESLSQSVFALYLCIPLSWALSALGMIVNYHIAKMKAWREFAAADKLSPEDREYYQARLAKKWERRGAASAEK